MNRINPENKRGDKNVVNGAQKTMKSCIKSVQNGQQLLKDVSLKLQQNQIKSNALTITWMYICLLKFIPPENAQSILKQYIQRMQVKSNKQILHENQQYRLRKKEREMKFVKSAEILLQGISKQTILQSAKHLFQYSSCTKKALYKLQNFMATGFQSPKQQTKNGSVVSIQEPFEVDKQKCSIKNQDFEMEEQVIDQKTLIYKSQISLIQQYLSLSYEQPEQVIVSPQRKKRQGIPDYAKKQQQKWVNQVSGFLKRLPKLFQTQENQEQEELYHYNPDQNLDQQ